jgi:hypothetical protein
MRRTVFLAVLTMSLASLVGCNNTPTPDGGTNTDSGTGTDAGGSGDAGFGGTLTTVSTGNALPAAFTSSSWQDFNPNNNDGGAVLFLNSIVEYTGPLTTSNASCPPPLSQPPYCNGFTAATADGGTLLISSYSFLGGSPTCSADFNAYTAPNGIRGIWQDVYNSADTSNTDTFMISPGTCSDITGTGGYTGTGTAPSTPAGSQTVYALLTGGASSGVVVTVSGVVTAYWGNASGTEFGTTIQDPGTTATANTGLYVYKSDKSPSTATHPNVGDYVTVTGLNKVYTNVGAGNATTHQVNL